MITIKLPSLQNIALLCVTIIIMVFVAEFAVKALAPQKCYPYPQGMVVEDNYTCYRNSPNFTGKMSEAEFSILVKTNSHGLRGNEYSYEKPPNVTRIFGLGDSFQFGFGVENNETYMSIIEGSLNKKANASGSWMQYEMLNAGVSGYGTLQELRLFEEEGKKYSPDIVILSFYANDLGDNEETSNRCIMFARNGYLVDERMINPGPISFKARVFLNQHSDLYCHLRNVALKVSPGLRLPEIENLTTNQYTILRHYQKGVHDEKTLERLNLTFSIIGQLKQAVESQGAKLVIVIIPERFQVDTGEWKGIVKKYGLDEKDFDLGRLGSDIKEFASSENITVIDMLPQLQEEGKSTKLYNYIDAHLNVEGHASAAKIIESGLGPLLNSADSARP